MPPTRERLTGIQHAPNTLCEGVVKTTICRCARCEGITLMIRLSDHLVVPT